MKAGKTKLNLGVAYLTVSSIFFMASGYIISVWLGRTLDPTLFGMYGILVSYMTLINVVQSAGVPQAAIKYSSEAPDRADAILKTAIKVSLLSNFGFTLITLALAYPLSWLFGDPALVPYWYLVALIFPFYGLFILYAAYNNGLQQFGRQTKITVAYSVAKLATVLALSIPLKLGGAILGFIISPLAAVCMGFRWPKGQDTFPAKKLLLFSGPLILFSAISTFQISIDLFFVKSMIPEGEAAGFFTAAQNIARIPYYALGAFALVLFPAVSDRLGRKEQTSAKNVIVSSIRYMLILVLPSTAFFAATSQDLIKFFFGSEYVGAAGALSVLLLAYAILSLFSLLANVMNSAGLHKKSWKFSLVGTVVAGVCYFLLIPPYGLIGASVATGIGALFSMGLSLMAVKKRLDVDLPFATLLRSTLVVLPLSILCILVHPDGVILIAWYTAMFALYLICMYSMKEFNAEDLRQVKGLIPKWMPIGGKK